MTDNKHHTLLTIEEQINPEPRIHYIDYPVTIPDHSRRVNVNFSFFRDHGSIQLHLSLFDPQDFRGCRMDPVTQGQVDLSLWVAPDDAGEGAIPGVLPAGEWIVRIDVDNIRNTTSYTLIVDVEYGDIPKPLDLSFPAEVILKPEANWYQGELHAHSTESDGKYPVADVIEAAIRTGLDFLALTDHFTTSQWRKLNPYMDQIALLHSCEITSHQGHANLHGLTDWVDVFVDHEDWSMNDAADAVHEQGGLFCVNHAYSGSLGWRAYRFDWHKADLFEIYHNLEGINNVYQVSLWDQLLALGYRTVGVAGIDSHDPYTGSQQLGQLVTYIYADQLSESGLIDGLKRGQVFISKGAQLRFRITQENQQATMWETLSVTDKPFTVICEVLIDEPMRLFVFRNGLLLDSVMVQGQPDTWQTIHMTDTTDHKTIYRMELHQLYKDPDTPYIQWRDHRTMQAMSNPIFVQPA